MRFPRRGEIWLVSLDPIKGHEIGKTRPAFVISNDIGNEHSDTVTVLPVTSRTERIYPFESTLAPGAAGLMKESKVKCNQIRTVDKQRLVKYLGTALPEDVRNIEQALLIHLDIA